MKKEEAYKWALKQTRAQVKRHFDLVATLANTAAILKSRFPNFFWVGFYFLKNDSLVMGPFQGPPACMRLTLDRGVCAEGIIKRETVIVPDVSVFPGHVACDSRSRSEIVVPLFNERKDLTGVIDVDSEAENDFDLTDARGLENIALELKKILP